MCRLGGFRCGGGLLGLWVFFCCFFFSGVFGFVGK